MRDVLRADIPNGVARVARMFDEIADAAERAARLTHQLLAFGRQQILRPRLLDLDAVVASMGADATGAQWAKASTCVCCFRPEVKR